jgi:crotonobetainyl-CoA:carnitine CoA-transferase CaiB-like acyl-CoA transferase
VGAALRDEQVLARENIESYRHDRLGEVRRVRSPLRLTGPRKAPTRAPGLGEHLSDVLAEAGISPEEQESFAAAGAFG